MEWLDYADCAGDDPLKWDLDHVEADDVQEYARNVCGSYRDWETDRKSTRLNSSHSAKSRMPSSA